MEELIELHIKGGGLVVTLDPDQDPAIYMMNPKPEVLFWSERIFHRITATRYEEACAVVAFTKTEASEIKVTLSGKPADLEYYQQHGAAPQPVDPETRMHKDYWVLSEEERKKGFVRPVRFTYVHEKCGTSTRMNEKIAEIYARNPKFYGATFCVACKDYFQVGEKGEFVWEDGSKVGS